jgi:hypothetical protein
VTALFSSHVRRQSLQVVSNARMGIEQTLLEIQEVQEHHFVALFLECLEDEFAQLSDQMFLTEATTLVNKAKSSDFRATSDQSARRLITGTDVPRKIASHLACFF